TPGFTTSAYEWCTASATVRPNITSSFEKPNTKPLDWSISTTSTSSPSSSESRVDSSRPANPAPNTKTLIDLLRLRHDADVGLGGLPLAEDLLGLVVRDRPGDDDVVALLPVHRR